MLALLTGVCWWMTIAMAVDFSHVEVQLAWQNTGFGILFLMWAIMMAAMMLPSFFPTLRCLHLLHTRSAPRSAAAALAAFSGGYLVLWLLFSLAATALQLLATHSGALSLSMALNSPALCALLLAAAGIFQFTRLKMKCLHGCRHPAFFFMLHWRGGTRGAWRMGLHNGLLCVGCCTALMLLLFIGGVMHLGVIALLTLYVCAEKLLPLPPQHIARGGGVLLLAAAAWQLSTYL